MDFSKLMARVVAILTQPKSEWPVIADEVITTKNLYRNYILWLAAIPPVFSFIKGSLIGYSAMGVHVREGIGSGIGRMIATYIVTLVLVYVVALIVNALAGTFDAKKDQNQALKTIAYAYTASWLAGVGVIIPWLGALIALVGGIYSIYLLYLGLPQTMKCPSEKAAGYTAVTVIITIVLGWILVFLVVGGLFASGGHSMGSVGSAAGTAGSSTQVSVDKDSALGKLQTMSQRMEAASKKIEAAQKSGDTNASNQALGTMMGAIAGSDGPVQALSPAETREFLPNEVNGLKRTSLSAERNHTMGMQTSNATAVYQRAPGGDESSKPLTLKITDTAGAKGLLGLAGAFDSESEKQTADGYERTFKKDGQLIQEKWNNKTKSGKYSLVVVDRFTVEASGGANSIDDLKRAVNSVDLKRLASLRDTGVKSG